MNTYRFDKNFLSAIMAHIDAYGTLIVSMTTDGTYYTITLDNPISEEEVIHLQSAYDLEVV
jgi:hypothetical protein